jgi:hypothetical protein
MYNTCESYRSNDWFKKVMYKRCTSNMHVTCLHSNSGGQTTPKDLEGGFDHPNFLFGLVGVAEPPPKGHGGGSATPKPGSLMQKTHVIFWKVLTWTFVNFLMECTSWNKK